MAKTVKGWMRQQAGGVRARQVLGQVLCPPVQLGAVLTAGSFTSVARRRAMKHHLSEGREATKGLANPVTCESVFHDDRKTSTDVICVSLYTASHLLTWSLTVFPISEENALDSLEN